MSLKKSATYLQRDPSTVSRFESGEYPIRRPDLLALLDLYRLDDDSLRQTLLKVGDEVWQTGWWDGYAEHVPGALLDLSWLEERALRIRSFDPLVIPGLLQTREYARSVIAAGAPAASAEQFERWVEFRMARQQVLAREDPLRLAVLVDEAVLRRPAGAAEVMYAQLDRLLETAAWPNVEVRVLPLRAGVHASPEGSFRLVEMPEPYSDIVHVSTPAGAIYVESDGVRQFEETYHRLYETALDPDASAALISDVMDDWK